MNVTDEGIRKYSEDGVVIMKNCFSPEWTGKLKKGLEKNLKAPSHPWPGLGPRH